MYAALSALRINLFTCTRAVGPGYYIQRLRRSSTTYAISISREVRYVVTVNNHSEFTAEIPRPHELRRDKRYQDTPGNVTFSIQE